MMNHSMNSTWKEKTSDGAGSMSLLKELHNIYVQHTHSNR